MHPMVFSDLMESALNDTITLKDIDSEMKPMTQDDWKVVSREHVLTAIEEFDALKVGML